MMSDEFTNSKAQGVEADKAPADSVASENMTENGEGGEQSQATELVALAIKSIAVALSVVMLVLSILTVALPLQAMRAFNSLGMYERALTSGSLYVKNELRSRGADGDKLGRYVDFLEDGDARATELASIPSAQTDEDLIEAFEVCISLSDKLMRESFAKGDNASAAYFGSYLEKYTRYLLSLTNASTVIAAKDARNYATFAPSVRPYVYSYRHTLTALNYRARVITGDTDRMLYDGGRNGDCVQTLSNRTNTYGGLHIKDDDGNVNPSVIDGFVDYVCALTESIAAEIEALGIDESLNETKVMDKYSNVLDGDEFSLFVTQAGGFSVVYNNLKNFSDFAQAAVDFNPANTDEQLHQLFWLQRLATASNRMWNMSMLLYYSADAYGLSSSAVRDEYGANTCELYRFVNYYNIGTNKRLISEVYNIKLQQYLDNFKG